MVIKCTYGNSERRRPDETSSNGGLDLLAEIATAISECGTLCGHSDPADCYLTFTKRQQNRILQAHHSLFHQKPTISPIRMKRINRHPSPSAPIPTLLQKTPVARTEEEDEAVEFPLLHNGASVSGPTATSTEEPVKFPPRLRIKVSGTIVEGSSAMRSKTKRIKHNCSSSSSEEAAGASVSARVPTSTENSANFPNSLRIRVSEAIGRGAGVMGSKFTLVIRKALTKTDMSEGHSRLSLPTSLIISNGFLTGEEKRMLHVEGKGRTVTINLGFFIDPDMEIVPEVVFVKWNMENGHIYNLRGTGWVNVAGKGRLAAGDWVELWSFRTEAGELCFALVTLEQRRAATASEKEEGRVTMIECGESSTRIGSVISHQEEEESQVGRNHDHGMMIEYGESSTKIGSVVSHEEEEEESQVGRNQVVRDCCSDMDLSLRL